MCMVAAISGCKGRARTLLMKEAVEEKKKKEKMKNLDVARG